LNRAAEELLQKKEQFDALAARQQALRKAQNAGNITLDKFERLNDATVAKAKVVLADFNRSQSANDRRMAELEAASDARMHTVGKTWIELEYKEVADSFRLRFADGWAGQYVSGRVGEDVASAMVPGAYYIVNFRQAESPIGPDDGRDRSGHAMAAHISGGRFSTQHVYYFDPNVGVFKCHFKNNGARLLTELFTSYKQDDGLQMFFSEWRLFQITR
jgi:hypothetical protein